MVWTCVQGAVSGQGLMYALTEWLIEKLLKLVVNVVSAGPGARGCVDQSVHQGGGRPPHFFEELSVIITTSTSELPLGSLFVPREAFLVLREALRIHFDTNLGSRKGSFRFRFI